jgi:hypothetical protein
MFLLLLPEDGPEHRPKHVAVMNKTNVKINI